MARLGLLFSLVLCWAPMGLIHQGQRLVNPGADSIAGAALNVNRCSPHNWSACR